MLVFSRKKNESIIIGEDVEITIVSVGRDFVKIGIDAPRNITIHRKEVYLAIERENREATQSVQAAKLKTIESWLKTSKPGSKKDPKK